MTFYDKLRTLLVPYTYITDLKKCNKVELILILLWYSTNFIIIFLLYNVILFFSDEKKTI